MEGNNKIIERILLDAQARCDEIANQASLKSAQLIEANAARVEALRAELESDCAERAKSVLANTLANAELELKKYRLKLKRDLLDQAYLEAYKSISASSDKYLAFFNVILKRCADKGETVSVAAKDAKVITQQFLDKLNLGLKIVGTCDIDGGVILHGAGYDKDLSLQSLFRTARDNSEIDVAKALFSE